jgi:hypothetical protein
MNKLRKDEMIIHQRDEVKDFRKWKSRYKESVTWEHPGGQEFVVKLWSMNP